MRVKSIAGVTTGNLFHVPPAMLRVDPGYNAAGRAFDPADESCQRLLAQIKASGVRTPLSIEAVGDDLIVRAGHRRLAAVLSLIADGHDVATVPCVAFKRGASDLDRVYDLAESNEGVRLTGLALADVFARAVALGESHDAVAARLGYSVVHVRVMLALHSAPAAIQDMVAADVVSATYAGELIQAHGPDEALRIMRETVAYEAEKGVDAPRVTPSKVRKARTVHVSTYMRSAADGGDVLEAGYTARLRGIYNADGALVATAVNKGAAAALVALLNR